MPSAAKPARTAEPAARSVARRSNTIATDPTFRRLLGEAAWQRLNPNVRARFAVKPGIGQVFVFTGVMDEVRRSRFGWLLGQVCRLIGSPVTPRQGRDVPTAVHIYRSSHGDGIVWERRYDFSDGAPVVVSSTKRPDLPDGLLECANRGFAMRLQLFERDGAMHFASTGYCLELGRWRLPIPGLLTPGTAHVIHSDVGDGRFRFTMSFRHPWFGETYYQQGLFHEAEGTP